MQDDHPIFKSVFGADWDKLPPVMKKHYANRAYHDEEVTAEGVLSIEVSRVGRLFFPLFRLMKTLIPREGAGVRTTVRFITTKDSDAFQFDRSMVFPDGTSYRFHSRMKPVGGNELVEIMRCGLGWHMAYGWDGRKVTLEHQGYKLSLFGFLIPLPLTFLLGAGYAEEIPINDREFSMRMEIRHPVWGKIYGYSGTFIMTDLLTREGKKTILAYRALKLLSESRILDQEERDSLNGIVHGLVYHDELTGICIDRSDRLLHYSFKNHAVPEGIVHVRREDMPQYTSSLDTQKNILPEGWAIERFEVEETSNTYRAVLKEDGARRHIVGLPQPTKELAALHACLLLLNPDQS